MRALAIRASLRLGLAGWDAFMRLRFAVLPLFVDRPATSLEWFAVVALNRLAWGCVRAGSAVAVLLGSKRHEVP